MKYTLAISAKKGAIYMIWLEEQYKTYKAYIQYNYRYVDMRALRPA
jgi:hypothetical protein